MKSFSIQGNWWLPNDREHVVQGVLNFDAARGAVLKIRGKSLPIEWPDLQSDGNPSHRRHFGRPHSDFKIIHGATYGKGYVTLVNCQSDGGSRMAPDYVEQRFLVEMVLAGRHFQSIDEVVFESVSLYFPDLIYWFGRKGLSQNPEIYVGEEQWEAQYLPVEPIVVRVGDTEISFDTWLGRRSREAEIKVREILYITIVPDCALQSEDYISGSIHTLRNFLAFASDAPVIPEAIFGKSPEDAQSGSSRRSVQIFYRLQGAAKAKRTRVSAARTLFRCSEVSESFPAHLQRWFAFSAEALYVCDLYFSLLYSDLMYIELQFLTLIQALETFHRTFYGGKLVLGRRLGMLLNEILSPYKDLLDGIISDRRIVVAQLVATRNYLTHHSIDDPRYVVTDAKQQYDLIRKMRLIVRLCLADRMELPRELVQQRLKEHPDYWGTVDEP